MKKTINIKHKNAKMKFKHEFVFIQNTKYKNTKYKVVVELFGANNENQ